MKNKYWNYYYALANQYYNIKIMPIRKNTQKAFKQNFCHFFCGFVWISNEAWKLLLFFPKAKIHFFFHAQFSIIFFFFLKSHEIFRHEFFIWFENYPQKSHFYVYLKFHAKNYHSILAIFGAKIQIFCKHNKWKKYILALKKFKWDFFSFFQTLWFFKHIFNFSNFLPRKFKYFANTKNGK